MGAYSPAPVFTADVQKKVMDRILNPLIQGFKRDGIDYKGILYAGLMIDDQGDPYVVEFNIRFGDPETQIVLPKLKTDLLDVFVAIAENRLNDIQLEWSDGYSVCVVMASEGYQEIIQKDVSFLVFKILQILEPLCIMQELNKLKLVTFKPMGAVYLTYVQKQIPLMRQYQRRINVVSGFSLMVLIIEKTLVKKVWPD